MIQQLLFGFDCLRGLKDKVIIFITVATGFIISYLLLRNPLSEASSLTQLLNNIIEFSGIFSGILITYIISKVFQIRQEKLERRNRIVWFANRTTDFRRIARVLQNVHGFWDGNMRQLMDNKYKKLTHFHIRIWDYENENKYSKELIELRNAFYQEKHNCGAELYLEIKALVLDDLKPFQLDLYNRYDYDKIYPLEIVRKWSGSDCGNHLWYFFDHKWAVYRKCFNFIEINPSDSNEILKLCQKINSKKYRGRSFDEKLLADIGSEFHGHILPNLYELTYFNSLGLPRSVTFILRFLFVTGFFGILIPLLLSAMQLNIKILVIAASITVWILCVGLFYFLLKFFKILKSELIVK
ncbi:MAG: hypothetical protein V9E90_10400 [Saprospiraceae bacterium]